MNTSGQGATKVATKELYQLAGICLLALWLPSCVTSPGAHSGAASDAGARTSESEQAIARPDAAVDYDALVGELAAQEGNFELARASYLRGSHKDPHSPYLQRKLARLSLKLDDVDAAVVHAHRAFTLDPEDEETRLFLAKIHRIRLDLAGVESVLLDEECEPFSSRAVLLL